MDNKIKPQLTLCRSALVAAVSLMTLTSVLSGCRTGLDMSSLRSRSFEERSVAAADQIKGPLQRILPIGGKSAANPSATGGYAFSERDPDYQAAQKLYDDGEHAAAETAFKQLVKVNQSNALKEDAMFMLAECQFQQKKYPAAQDSYDELLNEFPSSRHMSQAGQRLFQIGRFWLDFEEIVTPGEIQQVDFTQPGRQHALNSATETKAKQKKKPLSKRYPLIPNFTDKSRPWFDTNGRAMEALQSVWMKDPTGPLADDALMLTASYFLRKGDYAEADRFFTLIRKEYPDSPHFQNSFVLGSHVKQMSYQGPEYDSQHLKEARDLKKSTLRIFKDLPEREMIQDELKTIHEEEALKIWASALFYEKKKNYKGVAIYCKEVIRNYPSTQAADLARQKLAQLDSMPATPTPPKRTFNLPSVSIPRFATRNTPQEAPRKQPAKKQDADEPDWEIQEDEKPSKSQTRRSWLPWKWRQEPGALPADEKEKSQKLEPNWESESDDEFDTASDEDDFLKQLL